MVGLGFLSSCAVVLLCARSGYRCAWQSVIALVCVAVGCGVTGLRTWVAEADPDAVTDTVAVSQVVYSVTSPPVESQVRGGDCQYHAVVTSLERDRIVQGSHREVLVIGEGEGCEVVETGHYVGSGTLAPARFGRMATWLTLDASVAPHQVRAARGDRRVIAHLRASFLAVTGNLSTQGRILVPGITMGVLGPEANLMDSGWASEDSAISERMEAQFRNSGIVHLLAVSGGHFVLLSDALRRLMARLHAPRLVALGVVGTGLWFLSELMYPSDSVSRALFMGLMSLGVSGVRRPYQAMSGLAWTVIGSLVCEPSLAKSFGFALSCSAVMGILLFSTPLTRLFARRCPVWLAQASAVTVAAQVFTLPVQVLMTPQIPLMSVVANVCVAPFVTFSTLTGLAGLSCAWLSPAMGGFFAWLSSCGTLVMDRVAGLLGGEWAVLGVGGSGVWAALIVLITEGLIGILVRRLTQRVKRRRELE